MMTTMVLRTLTGIWRLMNCCSGRRTWISRPTTRTGQPSPRPADQTSCKALCPDSTKTLLKHTSRHTPTVVVVVLVVMMVAVARVPWETTWSSARTTLTYTPTCPFREDRDYLP
eukprot:Rmarinus@m.17562